MNTVTYNNCIISIDFKQRVSFIEHRGLSNEKKTGLSVLMESTFTDSSEVNSIESILRENDYTEDCTLDYEPGIYKCDIKFSYWQDNTPDSSDWNSEVYFNNVTKIEI